MEEEIIEKIKSTVFDKVIIKTNQNTKKINVIGISNDSSDLLYDTDDSESIRFEMQCECHNAKIRYNVMSIEGISIMDMDVLCDFFVLNSDAFEDCAAEQQ